MELLKRKKIIGSALVFLLGAFYFTGEDAAYTEISFINVDKGNVVQSVSITGSLSSEQKVNLQFRGSGKLLKNLVNEGDTVLEGDLISLLENSDQTNRLLQKNAELSSYRAKLDKLIAGSTEQEIRLKELEVQRSEIELMNAKKSILLQTDIDNNKIIELNSAIDTAAITLELSKINLSKQENSFSSTEALSSSDSVDALNDLNSYSFQMKSKSENALVQCDNFLGVDNLVTNSTFIQSLKSTNVNLFNDTIVLYNNIDDSLANLSFMADGLDKYNKQVEIFLNVQTLLDNTYEILTNATTSTNLSSSELDTYRSTISTVRTDYITYYLSFYDKYQIYNRTQLSNTDSLNNAQSNLIALEKEVEISEIAYQKAITTLDTYRKNSLKTISDLRKVADLKETLLRSQETNLEIANEDPREVDVRPYRADVSRSYAAVMLAKDDLEKQKLYAPFDGVITSVKHEPGEYVSSSSLHISIEAEGLYIKANVSETDVTKLELEDNVSITLDAYGNDAKFTGILKHVDPAETVVDGVIYYKIEVLLSDTLDLNVKSGMTSNLDIETNRKDSVLRIPLRLIKYDNKNNTYIKILENEKIVDKYVEIGLEGDNYVEILNGLDEEQEIISYYK
jgi:multidrug efflux pump subunit AcrA (membrane-fusion protein)